MALRARKVSGAFEKRAPGARFYYYSSSSCPWGFLRPEGARFWKVPKSRSKISNLMTTEPFYSRILNMNRGSLHTRSFRCIHLSVFKCRLTKNGFSGPKSFRGFRETGPRTLSDQRTTNYKRHRETTCIRDRNPLDRLGALAVRKAFNPLRFSSELLPRTVRIWEI